jgi:hypothetical protein
MPSKVCASQSAVFEMLPSRNYAKARRGIEGSLYGHGAQLVEESEVVRLVNHSGILHHFSVRSVHQRQKIRLIGAASERLYQAYT